MNANKGTAGCWYRDVQFRIGSIAVIMAVILLGLQGIPASAQQLTGSLSGIVLDQLGARIPNAKVELKSEATGEARATVSGNEGYFNITAVQPATYSLFVSATGFTNWEAKGIVMGLGDQKSVANITLKVAATGVEAITIVAGEDVMVPVDTAEISTTLNEKMISDLPLGGRNAGELLKIMPGFGRNTGLGQKAAFSATGAVGSNTGPVGDYSSNGTQPNGSMAYMLDGSNLIDPGNMGTQVANINQDMVSEVKVLTSSYGAEYAKGPVIFEAFSKTGTRNLHGEGYVYARNSEFNSWDWYTKQTYLSQGGGTALAASLSPAESYYYFGGNVGGPLFLPHLAFNKNHDKLFFWAGYEYMDQHPAASLVLMNVPTTAQLAGDFNEVCNNGVSTATSGAGVGGITYNPQTLSATAGNCDSYLANQSANSYAYRGMDGDNLLDGKTKMLPAHWDPNIKGLVAEGAYPTFNVIPSSANSWNNYAYASANPQNRWEATGKISYDFSENTKLNVSYTRQVETDPHPLSIWWAPAWTVPYPGGVNGAEVGNFIMGNLTHVFTPTTTNELVFNYSRWINASTLGNEAATDRKALGFNVGSVFPGKTPMAQIPNVSGPWGGALSNVSESSFNSGFDGGKGFGGIKLGQAIYDNFTKVVGTHSLKAGAYWDFEGNQQSGGNSNQGVYNLGWASGGTGNLVADMLTGRAGSYQESSADPTTQVGFHQWSVYVQDSWKANKQLTLNYGIRADHEGQWYGGTENGNFWWGSAGNNVKGMQVWNMATFVNAAPGTAPGNTGLEWNAIDNNIPVSGFPSKFLTYNPRVGFAYDIMGDGKTVLRGGYSVFQYQIAVNNSNNAWGGPQGVFSPTDNNPDYNTSNPECLTGTGIGPSCTHRGYAGISFYTPPGGTTENGSSPYAMQQGDNKNPYTADWNVTISRSLPWRSIAEVSYVGNQSKYLYSDGSNSGMDNYNMIQPGGIFRTDPITGHAQSPNGPTCNTNGKLASDPSNSTYCVSNTAAYANITWNQWDYAPYKTYQNMYVMSHNGFANYNSLQAYWQKQSGPVLWFVNYTFGKAMGIWDYMTSNGGGSGPSVESFGLKNNYGPLAYDHSQILNLSYIWNMQNFVKNGPLVVREAVNGWQISGYTSYQSGTPLQPNTNGNMNATYPGSLSVPYNDTPNAPDNSIKLSNGLVSTNMNTSSWYGTPNQRIILPVVTCDPRKGLAKGQYFNPKCFAPPAYGQIGTLVEPYMHAPAYFDSDLAVYKSFKTFRNQSFQVRVSATNFLNHPLKQFDVSGTGDISLNFTGVVTAPGGNNGHTLQSLSQTNTNTTTTGFPAAKVGNRTMLFSGKYFF